jgi:hypothetical protein
VPNYLLTHLHATLPTRPHVPCVNPPPPPPLPPPSSPLAHPHPHPPNTSRGKQDAVNSTRAKFIQPEGDQLTLLAVMRAYLEVDRRKRAQWASDNFINIR